MTTKVQWDASNLKAMFDPVSGRLMVSAPVVPSTCDRCWPEATPYYCDVTIADVALCALDTCIQHHLGYNYSRKWYNIPDLSGTYRCSQTQDDPCRWEYIGVADCGSSDIWYNSGCSGTPTFTRIFTGFRTTVTKQSDGTVYATVELIYDSGGFPSYAAYLSWSDMLASSGCLNCSAATPDASHCYLRAGTAGGVAVVEV